jgi:hypothetical protein
MNVVHSGIWITTSRKIALNYLKGWFLIDLVSVIPFDMAAMASEGQDDKVGKLLEFLFVCSFVLPDGMRRKFEDPPYPKTSTIDKIATHIARFPNFTAIAVTSAGTI